MPGLERCTVVLEGGLTGQVDERLAEASLAALAIVAVGLLPIYMLARQITRGRAVAGC